MPSDKSCHPFALPRRRFCCFCGVFGGFARIARRLTGALRGGVLFFNGPLLLPAGKRITGNQGIVPRSFFLQISEVGPVQTTFRFGRLPVRFQLVGTVGAPASADRKLGGFFAFMRGLHAYVVILGLPDFPVEL
ncbi:hypothetical protein SDC9_110778 [bioreactor metagenome]|uniref:Uncharacterized protein n=1 Tax=bioreactor metagenome TaxID=1076179 RepID=A0A645BQ12_9ZZZZ